MGIWLCAIGVSLAASVPDAGTSASTSTESGLIDIADLDLEAMLNQDVRSQKITVASRREETVGDAPAMVTVLTSEDFVRHDWRNVAEALRSVPGLYVSWGRDLYSTGVRGLSFPGDADTRVLVLVDGHTLNNPWNGTSNMGEALSVPPAAIERVEVIRGPASSVYGSSAFLAVVNIVRKRPTDEKPLALTVDALGSSTNSFRGELAGHWRSGFGLELSGFAMGLFGEGPPVLFEDAHRAGLSVSLPTASGGLTRGADFERGANVGLTASFKGFSLTGQWRERAKGLPTAPAGSIFGDRSNSVSDRHLFVEAAWRGSIGKHSLSVRGFADRFRTLRTLHLDPSDWSPDRWKFGNPRVASEGNADKYGGEVQAHFALGESDTLTAGLELVSTRISQPTGEVSPIDGEVDPATVSGGVKDATGAIPPVTPLNFAAYLQNDWRPHRKFSLVVGLRYDVNTVFFRANAPLSAFAPRAAAIFKPTTEATLKLSYGEAFRYPTVFEAFFDDQSSVCGNPSVNPERQRTVELNGAYNLAKAWNLSGGLYFMQLEGLLVRQTVDACYMGSGRREQFVNAGTVLVFGGEAGLDVRLPSLTLFANVSANHATQTLGTSSSRPANSPAVVGAVGAAVPLLPENQLTASLRLHLLSSRLDASLDPSRAVPAAFRGELSLVSRRLWKGLTFGVTGIAQLKLGETAGAVYQSPAPRDPVVGGDAAVSSVPQNVAEVRGHVGYEL